MAQNPNRQIDRTFLSLDLAEERGLIHRDYLAHCLRWSHVVKFLNQGHRYKDAVVLDVGCGKELPLAKLLYVNKMSPRHYCGVDANKFDVPDMLKGKKIPISIWAETDFCALDPEDVGLHMERTTALDSPPLRGLNKNGDWEAGNNEAYELPNVVVCFECLEHVTPSMCRRMLQHFQEVSSQDCHYFISTPCWNGSAAENHVNEMTFGALGGLIEDLGYKVEGVYGTFASIADYQDELGDVVIYDKDTGAVMSHNDVTHVFAALRNYYDTNVLATILAPLFPAKARNCLWHLTRRRDDLPNHEMFTKLALQPTPWSQHPRWIELSGFNHAHTKDCIAYGMDDQPLEQLSCNKEGLWLGK